MFMVCETHFLYCLGVWWLTVDFEGFDLSTMADSLYDEAIVDVIGPDTIISEPYVIKVCLSLPSLPMIRLNTVELKDLHLNEITPRQLNFSSSFNLVANGIDRRTKIKAFVLYFDTFFSSTGEPIPEDTKVTIVKEGEVALAEVWPVGGKPAPQRRASLGEGLKRKARAKITSFSTGPKSVPTHWKQTVFLLREPMTLDEGTCGLLVYI